MGLFGEIIVDILGPILLMVGLGAVMLAIGWLLRIPRKMLAYDDRGLAGSPAMGLWLNRHRGSRKKKSTRPLEGVRPGAGGLSYMGTLIAKVV
jgi:hypothetical protein